MWKTLQHLKKYLFGEAIMTEQKTSWSLFTKTMFEIYEIMDELCLAEDVADFKKKGLETRLSNRIEKIILIAKVSRIKYNEPMKLPLITRLEGNA